MSDDATRRAYWCELFAKLYSARQQCSLEDSRVVARMLYPCLSVLTPAQALLMLCSDPPFSDAVWDMARRANGKS
jgi:hypothetical protein